MVKMFGRWDDHEHHKPTRGFTLVEVLIVVAIMGLLVVIVTPTYFRYIDRGRVTLAVSTLGDLRGALEVYYVDYKEYPAPPVDFMGTGLDANGRVVVQRDLINQLNNSLFSIDSYVLVNDKWTVMATAKDNGRTVITMTQEVITH